MGFPSLGSPCLVQSFFSLGSLELLSLMLCCSGTWGIVSCSTPWQGQLSTDRGASAAQLLPASAWSPSSPSFLLPWAGRALPRDATCAARLCPAALQISLILAPTPGGGRKSPVSLIICRSEWLKQKPRGLVLSHRISKNLLNKPFPFPEGMHFHPHWAGWRADGQCLLGALLP